MKSRVVKQRKVVLHGGLREYELAEHRPFVYSDVWGSEQQVATCMKRAGLECDEHSNRVRRSRLHWTMRRVLTLSPRKALAEKVLEFRLYTSTTTPCLLTEIAEAVRQLWKDPTVPKAVDEHSNEFYLVDSAG